VSGKWYPPLFEEKQMNILDCLFRKRRTEIYHLKQVVSKLELRLTEKETLVSKLQRRLSEQETIVSEMRRRVEMESDAMEVEKAKARKVKEEKQHVKNELAEEKQKFPDAKIVMDIAADRGIPVEQVFDVYGEAERLKARLKEFESQCRCGCPKCNPPPVPCTCDCHDCCQVVLSATSHRKIIGDDDSDDGGPRVRPIQSPGSIFGDGPCM
jgi:hypothetical protein